jgi:hypothetical protein
MSPLMILDQFSRPGTLAIVPKRNGTQQDAKTAASVPIPKSA